MIPPGLLGRQLPHLGPGRLRTNPVLVPNTNHAAHAEISISQHTWGLPSKPKSLYHLTVPFSVPQPSPALTCNEEFQLSPSIADGCLLQFPGGKVSQKPPWGVFRGQTAWTAANRASLQNQLEVKRKITPPELFSMRLLLSSDNKNMPDCPQSCPQKLWSCSHTRHHARASYGKEHNYCKGGKWKQL